MAATPKLGRTVLVTVDPRQNGGSTTAPAIVTRVFESDDDAPDTVNLKVLLDSEETLWLTQVEYGDRPDDEELDAHAVNGSNRVAFPLPR